MIEIPNYAPAMQCAMLKCLDFFVTYLIRNYASKQNFKLFTIQLNTFLPLSLCAQMKHFKMAYKMGQMYLDRSFIKSGFAEAVRQFPELNVTQFSNVIALKQDISHTVNVTKQIKLIFAFRLD